jgi:hypothetical protein
MPLRLSAKLCRCLWRLEEELDLWAKGGGVTRVSLELLPPFEGGTDVEEYMVNEAETAGLRSGLSSDCRARVPGFRAGSSELSEVQHLLSCMCAQMQRYWRHWETGTDGEGDDRGTESFTTTQHSIVQSGEKGGKFMRRLVNVHVKKR